MSMTGFGEASRQNESLAIAVEVLLVTEALGPAYERLDLTAIERTD